MNVLNMNENYFQNEIASHLGKMLRDAFGKGPQSIYVSVERPVIVVYLRNFLTPTEKILLNQGQTRTIEQTRDMVMSSLIPEIKAYLHPLTGMNDLEFYYDWELHNHSGILVGRQLEESAALEQWQDRFEGKEGLEREILRMSQRIQKKPEHIYSRIINKRTLVVVRSGGMIDLSKELIRLGDEDQLRQAVNHLEKMHLRDNRAIEQALDTKIMDVFVDWNMERDKSVIVFILNPK
ncbi:Na-translocating system protein MpsC family protein [Paenibacillus oryzae]|uniref:Na-translocating system protein MpsC family protein n=1 Tax=Paenibacillus oryzae TaxID=1844972 RepID=UPI000AFF774E|nr:Na-translocating system protein MpsC family protein [Paenibacillus oryzae]